MHVGYLGGHGFGPVQQGGMPGPELANQLREAAAKNGKPLDIMLGESCFGASLEQLAQVGKSGASIAVVAEEPLYTEHSRLGRMPLEEMLKAAADAPDAAEAARRMVAQVDGHYAGAKGGLTSNLQGVSLYTVAPDGNVQEGGQVKAGETVANDHSRAMLRMMGLYEQPPVVAAVDMARLEDGVLPHLDKLAGALSGELAAGQRDAVFECIGKSLLDDGVFADLGRFLSEVGQHQAFSAVTRELAAASSEELGKSVLAVNSPEVEKPLSGMSFCPSVSDFKDSRMPPAWKTFITQISTVA